MKIALDVNGGDNAPYSNIDGAVAYLNECGNNAANLILLGDKIQISEHLNKSKIDNTKIEIHHTSQIVSMNEKASRTFRDKPDSSLVKAIQLVKENKAQGIISAGNTGALLSTSLFLIGKIPGVKRPAFAPFIPNINGGGFILCDAGANVDTKPNHLLQFSLMAEAYIQHLKKITNPRIALLNIGSEEKKGNELTISSHALLKKFVNNFIGNIESRYLMNNKADIVICDGFTGNIVLKLSEGIMSYLMKNIKNELIKSDLSNENLTSFSNLLSNFSKSLDHEEYGATPFLGINGVVMKCHGSSTAKGIKNSLIATQITIQEKLIEDIIKRLEKYSNIFEQNIKLSESNAF